jgi:glucose/arabinose dehydrogenase
MISILARWAAPVGLAFAFVATPAAGDWEDDWATAPGFSLSLDSEGFDFPSSIAVVPEPGPDPKDPRYFVTELRGTVSAVANDGSVHTFATDFHSFKPKDELPEGFEGQGGLAGICLDPANGYVFVTFIYRAEGNVIRNGMVRFQSRPGRFGLEPEAMLDLRAIFESDDGGVTHQIGGCRVEGDHLYVGVGDGWNPLAASDLGSTLGKVLRLDMEGRAHPDNPLAANRGRAAPAVFAYGFRNPFGISVTDGRVWVAENGVNADRVLEIQAGRDYLWDGTDLSITTNAAVVFPDAISPVQLDHVPLGSGFASTFAGDFLVALSGNPAKPGNQRGRTRGLIAISYDFGEERVTRKPRYLVEFLGTGFQSPVGVGVGPDAIYLVPLFPQSDGRSGVLRVAYEPDNEHRHVIGRPDTSDREAWAGYLIDRRGCLGCHTMGGVGGTAGPPLDRDALVTSIDDRLNDVGYAESSRALDGVDREPFASFAEARAEVLAASGENRRQLWTTYHLMEPRFDSPGSQMPNLGLTREEASAITDVLLAPESLTARIKGVLPRPRYVHIVTAFGIGAVGAFGLGWAARRLFRR